MAFNYSCFISYVHSGLPTVSGAPLREFVEEFESRLRGELEAQVDEPVFRDNASLSGGDVLDPALGEALCTSAAWVVVYVPRYMKREYCRREFAAMLLLEEERRRALMGRLPLKTGMIMPVLLRGEGVELPLPDAGERIWEDFKAYDAQSNPIGGNSDYSEKICRIAERIALLCSLDRELGHVLGRCGQFELPADPSGKEWAGPAQQGFPDR